MFLDYIFVQFQLAIYRNLIRLVVKSGFKVIKLSKAVYNKNLLGYEEWLTVKKNIDAADTINAIKEIGHIDKLVVDSYAIDFEWESELREYVGKIMVIDDLANRQHDCDILLDQNFYQDKDTRYNGLVPLHCQLLLGPKYAILRDEFYEEKKHLRKRNGKIKNILIFFGGSDLTNETMKALQAIVMVDRQDIKVNVIVGSSNPYKEEIKTYCKQYVFFRYYCQVDNIAEFMNEADLAIGAGGTTIWERCFLELPSIVIAISENQVKICEDCGKVGLIEYLGLNFEVTSKILYAKLCEVI